MTAYAKQSTQQQHLSRALRVLHIREKGCVTLPKYRNTETSSDKPWLDNLVTVANMNATLLSHKPYGMCNDWKLVELAFLVCE